MPGCCLRLGLVLDGEQYLEVHQSETPRLAKTLAKFPCSRSAVPSVRVLGNPAAKSHRQLLDARVLSTVAFNKLGDFIVNVERRQVRVCVGAPLQR